MVSKGLICTNSLPISHTLFLHQQLLSLSSCVDATVSAEMRQRHFFHPCAGHLLNGFRYVLWTLEFMIAIICDISFHVP